MTELTELGYPEGYHMGLSAFIWWIAIVIIAILGFILYLNARKSDLINVKETLLSKAILYMSITFGMTLVQIGVFYPNHFFQLFFLSGSFIATSCAFYYYYWEKNLTNIRWITTYSMVGVSISMVIGFVISIVSYTIFQNLADILYTINLSLNTIAYSLYIYLIFIFSKHVKGIKLHVSVIWISGVVLIMLGWAFEMLQVVIGSIFPSFMVLYLAPILLVIGLAFAAYGITTLFAKISSYYAQTQKCAVHRGVIEKGNIIFFCPSCGITYCESCYEQVIKKDGCWNCRYGVEAEVEKKWKTEDAIDVKKGAKPKHQSPNK